MMDCNVIWRNYKKIKDNKMIENVERYFRVLLPKDYIKIVKNFDGGRTNKNLFKIDNSEEVFGNMLTLYECKYTNIITNYEYVKDRLIDGIIPFADDPGGNLICFRYIDKKLKDIVFWDHEIEEPEKNYKHICNTFTEFLDMLYEDNEK